MKAYHLVLKKVYGISPDLKTAAVHILFDEKTGLDRYFHIAPDFRFIRVHGPADLKELNPADRNTIVENITDIDVLGRYIDLPEFRFSGFKVVRTEDITELEIISALQKDLIEQHSIFSAEGIKLLEDRLKKLFQRPELMLGIAAVQNDRIMVIKNDCEEKINCLFSNSQHIHLSDIEGSVWAKAVETGSVLRISDLAVRPGRVPIEEQAVSAGIRSLLISPLTYQGETIGSLEIFSPKPDDLGPMDSALLKQITPLFSVALKRGLDEMNKTVQSVIKEKCTAVHPSVEWRFRKAALSHMERMRQGIASEMEPIVFKNVVPFYGQSDIKGSSRARNSGIQHDLTRQLNLATDVVEQGAAYRSWPLLEEYRFRLEERIRAIETGLNSGDEAAIFEFLNSEMEPAFDELADLGPDVAAAVERYKNAIDPQTGMVYQRRKEYENSVSRLNEDNMRRLIP